MIDLHTHSDRSDGSDPPARIAELAAEAGCRAVALTDHDGLSGLHEAEVRARDLGVELVRGCEVSCSFDPGSLHLLCYFVADDSPLARSLAALREDRERRNEELIARLADLGIHLTAAEVAEEAGGGLIGRPHFAAVLVRRGHAASISDAFDRLLAKGGAAYVERGQLDADAVASLARSSGAVCVLAHPYSLGLEPSALERAVAELVDLGVSGMECFYANYDPGARADLKRLSDRLGLVATGGSDYHGTYKPGLAIGIGRGDLRVDDEVLDALREVARTA